MTIIRLDEKQGKILVFARSKGSINTLRLCFFSSLSLFILFNNFDLSLRFQFFQKKKNAKRFSHVCERCTLLSKAPCAFTHVGNLVA
jgi:hypothetical protein